MLIGMYLVLLVVVLVLVLHHYLADAMLRNRASSTLSRPVNVCPSSTCGRVWSRLSMMYLSMFSSSRPCCRLNFPCAADVQDVSMRVIVPL
ncbi:hypothetical protein BC567DRAFT_59991 [Phyllosticta citribraziliensis]